MSSIIARWYVFHLSTIREIGNPDDCIIPENPNPQPPPFKGNIGVKLPLDKMPSDIMNQILPMFGLQPSTELAHRDTMDAVGQDVRSCGPCGQSPLTGR